ncbi:MAG: TIGR03905 family TSCPD domain-containing protein [Oscillospiraceae bacterium]|nr:TIGR03905 family TSCPD domain-containing protein [Oscillospiraceae bacterium]
MKYSYRTSTVCATEIRFDLDRDIVSNIEFTGGCNGNLKAIAKLVDGWTVDRINEYLQGNTCGRRPTSCADQLAKAVKKAYNESINS